MSSVGMAEWGQRRQVGPEPGQHLPSMIKRKAAWFPFQLSRILVLTLLVFFSPAPRAVPHVLQVHPHRVAVPSGVLRAPCSVPRPLPAAQGGDRGLRHLGHLRLLGPAKVDLLPPARAPAEHNVLYLSSCRAGCIARACMLQRARELKRGVVGLPVGTDVFSGLVQVQATVQCFWAKSCC